MSVIELTPAAIERIREQLLKRPEAAGIRLEVKVSGCSGWAYKMDFAESANPDDHRFGDEDAVLLVPEASLPALQGTVVDFSGDGFNRRWSFQNPNVEADCGCGESFALRKDPVSG